MFALFWFLIDDVCAMPDNLGNKCDLHEQPRPDSERGFLGESGLEVQRVFDDLRADMAFRNKRGLAFLCAGMTYWLLMTVAGLLLSEGWAAVTLLVGAVMIIPLSTLFSRRIGVRPARYANPVEEMAGWLLPIQAMFWPVYLMVFAKVPAYLPQTMSLLMVTPFVVLGYLYGSKAYFHVAVFRWLLCGTFMVFPAHSFVVVPLLTAGTYGYAAVAVRREL